MDDSLVRTQNALRHPGLSPQQTRQILRGTQRVAKRAPCEGAEAGPCQGPTLVAPPWPHPGRHRHADLLLLLRGSGRLTQTSAALWQQGHHARRSRQRCWARRRWRRRRQQQHSGRWRSRWQPPPSTNGGRSGADGKETAAVAAGTAENARTLPGWHLQGGISLPDQRRIPFSECPYSTTCPRPPPFPHSLLLPPVPHNSPPTHPVHGPVGPAASLWMRWAVPCSPPPSLCLTPVQPC